MAKYRRHTGGAGESLAPRGSARGLPPRSGPGMKERRDLRDVEREREEEKGEEEVVRHRSSRHKVGKGHLIGDIRSTNFIWLYVCIHTYMH